MGGFGVLTIALARPEAFQTAVASSPSLWLSYSAASDGAFDSPADFDENDVVRKAPDLRGRALRIDCGVDDVFASSVGRIRSTVPELDVNLRAGFHDDSSWRSFLPAQLRFIDHSLRG